MPPVQPPHTATDPDAPATVHAFCLRILRSGDLETKLAPPLKVDGHLLPDIDPGPAVEIDRPVRNPGLSMGGGGAPLPRPGQLVEPEHRRTCLARFAHHELMAVEYFAWALVRWPRLPSALRRGLLSALADEQRHCQLYLDRLAAHGGRFDTDDHSDYFWRHAPAIASAPDPPMAFLAAMGLTLEQANLDFTITYRDAFRQAGDAVSADVCQEVHDDEIVHVALAAHWLTRLAPDSEAADSPFAGPEPNAHADDLDAYLAHVPFPLGPARAKGRRFEVGPRKRAGLSPTLIEHVKQARSTQEQKIVPSSPPRHASSPDGSGGLEGPRKQPKP